MTVSPIIEEYLEAIYLMNAEGKPVVGARLAALLKVSAPTVTETVKRMQRDGYVTVNADKEISLSPMGRELGEALVRRHGLSERLLTDILGMDWYTAHVEACKLEHAISPEVEEKLAAVLGNPTTCPHGNPIPGVPGAEERPGLREVRLSDVKEGQTVRVKRISQEAELNAELLAHFDRHGLRPGAILQVAEVLPVNDTVEVLIGVQSVTLGMKAAEELWVSEEGEVGGEVAES